MTVLSTESPRPSPASARVRSPAERTGKDLLNATRVYVEQERQRSWRLVGSTLAALLGVLTVAALAPWWPVRLAASVLGGLLMGRSFILYHDFMHGSILRGSRPAEVLLHGLGLLMLAPPRSWRESHNYHHANVAKLGGPAIGSYPIMTTAQWSSASRLQRFHYRLNRHPLTLLTAYLTIFGFTLTLEPLLRNPRKNWDSLLSIAVHGGAMTLLWLLGGFSLAFFVLVLPFAVAAALGAYLFYAQHNSQGIRMFPPAEWTYFRAALESASYMKLGPVMSWLLGNIGYHHVHHLNPSIPFNRLPEAMAAIPELQHPTVTSLRPRDVLAAFRSNLWDEETSHMVSYREAAKRIGGRRWL
jgi:omega-6 fatty acid desaturase (delta-12 desaturase)